MMSAPNPPENGERPETAPAAPADRPSPEPAAEYPHDIHPGLVPGVSIEDQKVRYGIDKPIVGVVGAAILGFVAWGVIAPMNVFEVSSAGLEWVMSNLG